MKIYKLTKTIIKSFLISQLMLGALYAQVESYTIDDAIKVAIQNNRSIKVSMMEVEKADKAVDEAFGYALPTLDLSANYSRLLQKPKTVFPDFESLLKAASYGVLFDEGLLPYDETKIPTVGSKLQSFAQTNNFDASLELTQILFNSAVFRGIGASQIYLDLSREQLKEQVSATVLDVKKAFYGAVLARDMKEITEASLANAEENLKNVEALNKQGLASDYEYLQVMVQVENIRPKVKQLQNLYEDAKNGLKVLLGLDVNKDIYPEGTITFEPVFTDDVESVVDEALTGNPTLKVLNKKRQVDEEFIAIDRSEYWPTLAAFGKYSYAGSSDDFNFNTYNSATVGLSLSINLFKGGRVSSKVQQSKIALKQTDQQVNNYKDYLQTQITSKIRELRKVEAEISALEQNIKLAEKAYDISETRYKEGTGTQLEIKNSDLELRAARTNRLESVHRYIIASSELNNLLGRLDDSYMKFIKIENK